MNHIFEIIKNAKVIPVIKLNSVEDAVPLARSLLEKGIPVVEITFRTAAAAEGIAEIRKNVPEILVGAGTVINMDFAKQAVEAGAQFVVSPGFNPTVVDYVLSKDVVMIPGVATPSEIEIALCKGLEVLKFFPAEALGGVKMLKAFAGPFPNVMFIPTGGINDQNAPEYLSQKNVLAVGRSW